MTAVRYLRCSGSNKRLCSPPGPNWDSIAPSGYAGEDAPPERSAGNTAGRPHRGRLVAPVDVAFRFVNQVVRKVVRAGGHAISYQEAGPIDGPVVVLLHGLASDSDTWDKAIGPLASHGLRILALDLIGHGK